MNQYIIVIWNSLGMMSVGRIFYIKAKSEQEAINFAKTTPDYSDNYSIEIIEITDAKKNTMVFKWD